MIGGTTPGRIRSRTTSHRRHLPLGHAAAIGKTRFDLTAIDSESPGLSLAGASAMPIPARKCDAALGAEIVFDLSQQIDDAIFAELERLFHGNIVVFFREQRLTEEQHIAFSRRFGELEIHIVTKYLLPGYPEILRISNIRHENGEHIGLADAGFTWHSDTSYRRQPSRCSLLYAKEVPHRDGSPLGATIF